MMKPQLFATLDDLLNKYQVYFHIANESIKRNELLSEDILDFLHNSRNKDPEQDVPTRLYSAQRESSEANLNLIINLVKNAIEKKHSTTEDDALYSAGKPINVETEEGEKDAISFEHLIDLPFTFYIIKRIKGQERYGEKVLRIIREQDEISSFCDLSAFRIVVEDSNTTKYRAEIKFNELKQKYKLLKGDKKKFIRENGLNWKHWKNLDKLKFSELKDERIEEFIKAGNILSHKDLFKEKIYRNKLDVYRKYTQENIKQCRRISKTIAGARTFSTIPLNPHHLLLGDIGLRAQRQIILDYNGKELLELEYFLGKEFNEKEVLLNKLKEEISYNYSPTDRIKIDGYDLYKYNIRKKSENKKPSELYLIRKDKLILAFYKYNGKDHSEIVRLAKKIFEKYDKSRKEKETDKDKKYSEVMKKTKLRMEDIPLGQIIFSETRTLDLIEKYSNIKLDDEKINEIFIKDRLDRKGEYGDLKFFICLNIALKQINAECQIRDPEANHDSITKYLHDKMKKGELKGKEEKFLSEEEKEFALAFFGKTEEKTWEALRNVYSKLYYNAIAKISRNIINQETPMEDNLELLGRYFKKSVNRITETGFQEIMSEINTIIEKYIEKKGLGIIQDLDNLWSINSKIVEVSKSEEVKEIVLKNNERKLKYFRNKKELSDKVYKKYLDLLCYAFRRLTESKSINDKVASLFVDKLIDEYPEHYEQSIGGENYKIKEKTHTYYKNKIENFRKKLLKNKEKPWRRCEIKGVSMGAIPDIKIIFKKIIGRNVIEDALKNKDYLDKDAVTKIMGIYDKYVRDKRVRKADIMTI